MGSGPRPSSHRDGALPLAYTCYFGPRARFINIYLRVSHVSLLTTYLMKVNEQSKEKSAWAGDQSAAFFFFRRPKPKIGFFGVRRRSEGLYAAAGRLNQRCNLGPFYRGHQKVVFRRQKRTTFDVKNSTYFTFYVGHSTRQGISLLRVSNRITHDIQPHTSQLHSVQQLTLIFTIVRYFEYCFQKSIAAPRWTPADAAPPFHTPRSSDT